MLYVDYNFDLDRNHIILDEEINIDRLGWKAGDFFKVVNRNGKTMLIRVDPVVAFVQGYSKGEQDGHS